MKFRIALVAVLALGLAASFAVAAPAKGPKGKTGTTGTTGTTSTKIKKACRPRVSLILKGTLVSIADDQLSFTMNVKHANRHAKLYEGQTVIIQVDANTKVRRLGEKVALSALTLGDRLVVQTRRCKKTADATAALLAARIVARPAAVAATVCRPRFGLILRGTLASIAGDQLSFTMNVKHASKRAKLYEGQTITVQVDAKTRIWRLGTKVALSDLTLGDRLNVQTRFCKKGTDATAPLLAARVVARPAKPAPTTTTTT